MKKTSLFLLLFVSMSSLCAMDEVALNDLRIKVKEVDGQGPHMEELMERVDGLKAGSDRFNNAGQKPKRSLLDRFLGRNKSSGPQTAPRAIRGSEEASTFGAGGPDEVTARVSKQNADASADRGLRLTMAMDNDGNSTFGDEDKGTWDWGSSKNSRRMDSLNDFRNGEQYATMNDSQKSNVDKALQYHAEQTQKSWWLSTFTNKGQEAEKTLNSLTSKDAGAQFKPGERSRGQQGRQGTFTDEIGGAERSSRPLYSEETQKKLDAAKQGRAQRAATRKNRLDRAQEISGNLKNNSRNYSEATSRLLEQQKNKKSLWRQLIGK